MNTILSIQLLKLIISSCLCLRISCFCHPVKATVGDELFLNRMLHKNKKHLSTILVYLVYVGEGNKYINKTVSFIHPGKIDFL